MDSVVIDFESRSFADLKECGAWEYSMDPSTEVLCLVFRCPNARDIVWLPQAYGLTNSAIEYIQNTMGDVFIQKEIPHRVKTYIDCGVLFEAFNAEFEYAMWNNLLHFQYGWPRMAIERMVDTMATCARCGLPQSLEGASNVLGFSEGKDMAGHKVMMSMKSPRTNKDRVTSYFYNEDSHTRLIKYCHQDTIITESISNLLPALSKDENLNWVNTLKVNERGIYIDRASVKRIIDAEESNIKTLGAQLGEVTHGEITEKDMKRTKFLAGWITKQGFPCDSVAAEHVTTLLAREDLPKVVRIVLEARQQLGRSATAKFRTMINATDTDGRMRGMFTYYGASKTGRFAGRLVQPHNLVKPVLEQPSIDECFEIVNKGTDEEIIQHFLTRTNKKGNPISTAQVLSSMVRGALIPQKGYKFMAADYAAIEARGLAWLAGCDHGVKLFRDSDNGTGPEPYKVMAASIFKVPADEVTGYQRGIGKTTILGAGYGMSGPKFELTCEGYGLVLPEAPKEYLETYNEKFKKDKKRANEEDLPKPTYAPKGQYIVDTYRSDFAEIKNYWYDVGKAAIEAVNFIGQVARVGQIAFKCVYKGPRLILLCLLPSGRTLWYQLPRVSKRRAPWGELVDTLHYSCMYQGKSGVRIWGEIHTHGAHLVENICQAVCRDLLCYSIENCEKAGLPVVLHVHDEVVVEVPDSHIISLSEYESLVAQTPKWAAGFPVMAKGWVGKRYRKD